MTCFRLTQAEFVWLAHACDLPSIPAWTVTDADLEVAYEALQRKKLLLAYEEGHEQLDPAFAYLFLCMLRAEHVVALREDVFLYLSETLILLMGDAASERVRLFAFEDETQCVTRLQEEGLLEDRFPVEQTDTECAREILERLVEQCEQ